MRWLVLAIAFLLSRPVLAQEWTSSQRWLLAGALVLHAADWSQTRQIHAIPDRYEINPILGRKPPPSRVDTYFLATGAALVAAAHFLPRYRTPILGIWFGVELIAVGNNLALGIRIGG